MREQGWRCEEGLSTIHRVPDASMRRLLLVAALVASVSCETIEREDVNGVLEVKYCMS